jgi:hypothetical protein
MGLNERDHIFLSVIISVLTWTFQADPFVLVGFCSTMTSVDGYTSVFMGHERVWVPNSLQKLPAGYLLALVPVPEDGFPVDVTFDNLRHYVDINEVSFVDLDQLREYFNAIDDVDVKCDRFNELHNILLSYQKNITSEEYQEYNQLLDVFYPENGSCSYLKKVFADI